ncbi:hypothetical protein BC628DRAFT_75282 [Trametes gibbosa]|nr:hypothetical protein BC628DRAFT_75282 [Trametes gibbosa]
MFSFSTVSVFATLALGAVTSALPLAGRGLPLGGGLPDVSSVTGSLSASGLTNAVPVGDVVGTVASAGLIRRHDAVNSLAAILADAQCQLTPFTNQLKFVNDKNATVEALTEPVNHIKDILTATADHVKALDGLPINTILAAVDGSVVLTVEALAAVVASLVILVFDALAAVIRAADGSVLPAVGALLATVGGVVGVLLTAVLAVLGGLVAELLATLVPLLADIVHTVYYLNLATIVSLLGL